MVICSGNISFPMYSTLHGRIIQKQVSYAIQNQEATPFMIISIRLIKLCAYNNINCIAGDVESPHLTVRAKKKVRNSDRISSLHNPLTRCQQS